MDNKEYKIEFAPGCFDSFEGTQEELDELIASITASIKSGEFLEKLQPFEDDEDLIGYDIPTGHRVLQ